jgi:hypothetical protein
MPRSGRTLPPGLDDSPAELRERAARARRLSRSLSRGADIDALQGMADELDGLADRLEASAWESQATE